MGTGPEKPLIHNLEATQKPCSFHTGYATVCVCIITQIKEGSMRRRAKHPSHRMHRQTDQRRLHEARVKIVTKLILAVPNAEKHVACQHLPVRRHGNTFPAREIPQTVSVCTAQPACSATTIEPSARRKAYAHCHRTRNTMNPGDDSSLHGAEVSHWAHLKPHRRVLRQTPTTNGA